MTAVTGLWKRFPGDAFLRLSQTIPFPNHAWLTRFLEMRKTIMTAVAHRHHSCQIYVLSCSKYGLCQEGCSFSFQRTSLIGRAFHSKPQSWQSYAHGPRSSFSMGEKLVSHLSTHSKSSNRWGGKLSSVCKTICNCLCPPVRTTRDIISRLTGNLFAFRSHLRWKTLSNSCRLFATTLPTRWR
jgi:hypothetical protein